MRRLGFAGLALLLAGTLGMTSVSLLSGDEMSPVRDDDALQILGGAYCAKYTAASTTACGGTVTGKGNCPYGDTYTTTGGNTMGTVLSANCSSCGTNCSPSADELLQPPCN
jgi:hypothetical protein